jgi:hypothetical protein
MWGDVFYILQLLTVRAFRYESHPMQTRKETTMIIVRDVFQAKYGKGSEVAALFKEAKEKWSIQYAPRILTDASGPFFTVVTETESESLAAFEQKSGEIFSMPEFGDWFERMTLLVESGRREFYNIV